MTVRTINDTDQYLRERVAALPEEIDRVQDRLYAVWGEHALPMALAFVCGTHKLDPDEYVPKLEVLYWHYLTTRKDGSDG